MLPEEPLQVPYFSVFNRKISYVDWNEGQQNYFERLAQSGHETSIKYPQPELGNKIYESVPDPV